MIVEELVTSEAVRGALDKVLQAHAFRVSERLRRLLRHLVESCLAGNEQRLNQRELAEAVFERTVGFDPDRDAIVRVEMRKLRQALDLYYLEQGQHDAVVISVPKGGYVPRFEVREGAASLPAPEPGMALRLAVMPFRDLSRPKNAAWLANGVHEDIMTILGRIPELHLVSVDRSDGADAPPGVVRDLYGQRQVRYLLDGSIRLIGKQVRVTARLYDTMADCQIWSGRYDRVVELDSLLAMEEDIARHVVAGAVDLFTGAIGQKVRNDRVVQSIDRDPVYAAQIAFHRYLHESNDVAYDDALEHVTQAGGLFPDDPLLLSMRADLLRAGYALGFRDVENPGDEALTLGERALAVAPDCVPCRVSLCFTLLFRRDTVRLQEEIEHVLVDPTAPTSYRSDAAVPMALSGRWEEGCAILETLIRDSDVYPHYFRYPLFLRAYRQGDYDEAGQQAERFSDTGFFWAPMLKAAVCGKLGQRSSATQHLADLLVLRPAVTTLARRSLAAYIAEDVLIEDVVDGLRRAGLSVA